MLSIPDHRPLLLQALCVFAAVLLVYVFTMPVTITLEDAGLFQMVCHGGGIGHPPGYPLFILGCQGFVNLPFFTDGVFAANFLSAIFASLACAGLVVVGAHLFRDSWLAVFVALVYGVSATFWSQAIIVEVYSLAVLNFVVCLWLCLKYQSSPDVRYLYFLAFFFGLALSNHWPLIGLASPALACLLLARWRTLWQQLLSPRTFALCLGLLLAGLIPYLSLFQSNPPFAIYGSIETPRELFQYLSRAAYDDHANVADWSDKLSYQRWLLGQSMVEFGYVALPMIILGLGLSFRRLGLSVGVALLLLYLGSTSVLTLLIGFEFNSFRQAIFRPYPIVAYLSLAIWLGVGAEFLVTRLARFNRNFKGIILGALVLSTFLVNVSENNRRDNDFAEQYARHLLGLVPEHSILFVEGDTGVGLIGYLHHIVGVRRDIDLRSWNSLVFANRVSLPDAPEVVQQQARDEVLSLGPPVLTSVSHSWPAVNRGLVFEVVKNGVTDSVEDGPEDNVREAVNGFHCDGEIHPFINYLLDLNRANSLSDGHEVELLFAVLLDVTRQHVGLVLNNRSTENTEVEILDRLQETLPGKLAILETMITAKHDESGKVMLRDMAEAAAEQLPPDGSKHVAAILLEYRGRIEMIPPADTSKAREYFERSLQRYASADNFSICPLWSLYESSGNLAESRSLSERFDLARCD